MGFWDALLKAGGKAAKNMGKAAAATGRSAGQAVLHPSQTLRGAGQAMKTAAIGSAAGYVAWEKFDHGQKAWRGLWAIPSSANRPRMPLPVRRRIYKN